MEARKAPWQTKKGEERKVANLLEKLTGSNIVH